MNCTRVQLLLEEYLEGALPPAKEQVVKAHLAACGQCAEDFHQLQRLAGVLQTLSSTVVAETLLLTISSRLASLPSPEERRRAAGWRWACVSALGIAVMLVAGASLLPIVLHYVTLTAHQAGQWAQPVWVWITAAPKVLWALFLALSPVLRWLEIVLKAIGPTLLLYVALEIASVAAVVVVMQTRRRRAAALQLLLV